MEEVIAEDHAPMALNERFEDIKRPSKPRAKRGVENIRVHDSAKHGCRRSKIALARKCKLLTLAVSPAADFFCCCEAAAARNTGFPACAVGRLSSLPDR